MILYDSKAIIETISALSHYLFSVGLSNNPGIVAKARSASRDTFISQVRFFFCGQYQNTSTPFPTVIKLHKLLWMS
jgi:hypothetical protein